MTIDPNVKQRSLGETFGRWLQAIMKSLLVAGGHTFGKSHGAAPRSHKGPEPRALNSRKSTGWNSNYKSGLGADTISSGIEGAWTSNPIKWDMG